MLSSFLTSKRAADRPNPSKSNHSMAFAVGTAFAQDDDKECDDIMDELKKLSERLINTTEPKGVGPVCAATGQLLGIMKASREVAADGREHPLEFSVPVEGSSWVALRQFPQLHTNPVTVLVGGKSVRASRQSALWCIETINLLWLNRGKRIIDAERPEAERAFQLALEKFEKIAQEAPAGS